MSEVEDFERYVRENSSEAITRKRQLRMTLRALEGQIVRWPYDHVEVCAFMLTVSHVNAF